MTDIGFRRADPSDAPLIHALLAENAAHDGGAIAGSAESLLLHGFERGHFRVILAERANRAVGLALVLPEYFSWRGSMGVFVQDLYVVPAARGIGLGRSLLSETLRFCADWEPTFVTLMVQHKNAAARGFYAAQGFTARGEADILICEGEALMRLAQP